VGSCDHSNESPGATGGREFSDHLNNYLFLMDLAPWCYFLNTEYRGGSFALLQISVVANHISVDGCLSTRK
jgi:hypothetical protein